MNPEDFAERWAAEQERRYQAQMEAADMRQEAAEAHAAREVSFTEREEFEAWWMLSPMTSNRRPARLPDGQYANSLADHAWNGWQGRAAATIDLTEGMLEKVAAPDGWKLVPVEVTPEMEAAYYDPRKGVGAAAEWGAMLDAAPNVDAPMMGMAPPATAPGVLPEPEAYLFQHEETGQTMFVEAQQVEWGFEANNPRLQKISGVYTEEQVRELLAAHGITQKRAKQRQGETPMVINTSAEHAALYREFCEWCNTVPYLDLDPRLHTHGGRIEDGGYISDIATAKAFAAWQAARRATAAPQPQADAETLAQAYERGRRHGFHNRVAAYMEAKEQYTIADALGAERYRWLRNCDVETRDNGGVFVGCAKGKIVLNGADLDAVVGAAIAAAKEKP